MKEKAGSKKYIFYAAMFAINIAFATVIIVNEHLMEKNGSGGGQLWILLLVIDLLLLLSNKSQEESANTEGNQSALISIMKIIAAVGVFACHTADCAPLPDIIRKYTLFFSSGVEVFFVISGFTIWKSLEHCKNNTVYAIKRSSRILPLYYCVITAILLFTILTNRPLESDYTGLGWSRYYLFISTIVPTEQDCWVNLCATWSIPTFLTFYILAPLLKKIIKSYNAAALSLPICWIVGQYLVPALLQSISGISETEAAIMASVFPLVNIWVFMFGVCAYYAVMEHREREFVLYVAIILFVRFWMQGLRGRVDCTIVASLLLVSGTQLDFKGKWKTIANKISKYTFSLYLCHPAIWYMSVFYRDKFYSPLIYALFLVLMTGMFTYILHHLVEIPSAKVAQKVIKRQQGKFIKF